MHKLTCKDEATIIGGRKTSPSRSEGRTRSFSEEPGREVTARSVADMGAGTGTDAGDPGPGPGPGNAGAQHVCRMTPLHPLLPHNPHPLYLSYHRTLTFFFPALLRQCARPWGFPWPRRWRW